MRMPRRNTRRGSRPTSPICARYRSLASSSFLSLVSGPVRRLLWIKSTHSATTSLARVEDARYRSHSIGEDLSKV
jgi:hypothetical protein